MNGGRREISTLHQSPFDKPVLSCSYFDKLSTNGSKPVVSLSNRVQGEQN
jgi:hypothetical protein